MSYEVLRQNEIKYVEAKLDSFQPARLCDSIGLGIIAEFGFKGNKQKVFDQLNDYYEHLLINELTDEEEDCLLDRKNKYNEHLTTNESFTVKQLSQFVKKNKLNMDDNKLLQMYQISEDAYMLKNILHEEKMCACYNND